MGSLSEQLRLIELIGRLLCRGPLANPTVEHVLRVAPHLDKEEAAELFENAQRFGTAFFIGPPAMVIGAEHRYVLTYTVSSGFGLYLGRTVRRAESYACTVLPANFSTLPDSTQRERVSDYAAVHYGEHMRWDRAAQHVEYRIVNPYDHDILLMAGYSNWQWIELDEDERDVRIGCPLPQLLDRLLTAVSIDPVVSAEMRGQDEVLLVVNCMLCGGSVSGNTCTVCKFDGYKLPSVPELQLPLHIRLYTEAGIASKFKINPVNAIKMQYADWASRGFVSPCPVKPINQRVITLTEEHQE